MTINNTLGFPNLQAPFVVPATGVLTPQWQLAFQPLIQPPQAIKAVALTGSPLAFTADMNGTLSVQGGTVSAVTLTRGRRTIPVGAGDGLYPMSKGDTLTVTYSVAPTINFFSR